MESESWAGGVGEGAPDAPPWEAGEVVPGPAVGGVFPSGAGGFEVGGLFGLGCEAGAHEAGSNPDADSFGVGGEFAGWGGEDWAGAAVRAGVIAPRRGLDAAVVGAPGGEAAAAAKVVEGGVGPRAQCALRGRGAE
ncbi:hypothetical protein ACL02S_23155 [Nocardia sp. 004]|uniref:hypothetical protein n=1 Tax=Nocardia sp. 004 TaxID=3385978 RepID=UPI0039A2C6DA